jgi:hypothetical protein
MLLFPRPAPVNSWASLYVWYEAGNQLGRDADALWKLPDFANPVELEMDGRDCRMLLVGAASRFEEAKIVASTSEALGDETQWLSPDSR